MSVRDISAHLLEMYAASTSFATRSRLDLAADPRIVSIRPDGLPRRSLWGPDHHAAGQDIATVRAMPCPRTHLSGYVA